MLVTAAGNLLFLVVCVFQGSLLPHALCGAAVMSRDKRSDDPPAMEAVVNALSERLTQLEAQVTAQGNANSQLQHQHDQLQSRFDASQTMIAFTAWSTGPFSVAGRGTLVYNHAEVNMGGGFDHITGVFTCPKPGLYIFFVNCDTANPHADLNVHIMVDGHEIAFCYAHSTYDQGAAMATVRLTAGQKVWVKMFRDTPRQIETNGYNSFSGFLVKSED